MAYSGVSRVSDESEQKIVVLVNTLTIILSGFTLVFTVVSSIIFPTQVLWKLPLLYGVLIFGSLVLNGKGKRLLSRLYFTVVSLVFIGVMSYLVGGKVLFHFFLVTVALVQFFIYPTSQRSYMFTLAILAIVELAALHVWLPENGRLSAPPDVQKWIAAANIIGTGSLVLALSAHISSIYRTAESYLHIEREKSERLLLNILPATIVEKLRESPDTIAERFEECTILFSDIVGFTEMSHKLNAVDLVRLLNEIFSEFDDLAEKHNLEKIKTIGDAYMVVGGLPEPSQEHAERVARFALDMLEVIRRHRELSDLPLEIRIGIASGDAVAGVIGKKKFVYDLWGSSVNTASRMESSGIPGQVQVTEFTYELLKDKFHFERRGTVDLKGLGQMNSYLLVSEINAAVGSL